MMLLSDSVEVVSSNKSCQKSGIINRVKNSLFFIKLTNWEYWPLYIANIPLIFIWLWFALKAKKLFFFSAVNPVIETGGMWGESKFNILERIPKEYLPITFFVKKEASLSDVKEVFDKSGLVYPVIAKPDVGERGTLVSKINSDKELESYLLKNNINFLVQEFIDLPIELAVMYHRFPDAGGGKVTSVCIKETLKVVGDGTADIEELMERSSRAKLQLQRFKKYFPLILEKVPQKDEKIELEPIGNHCRGTMFLNGNHIIDDHLHAIFDKVGMAMQNIYYGRFDLKCGSIQDLKNGKGFKVMEYNGIGAEPAHIYDPSYPLFKKYQDIYQHWKIIYQIFKIQKRKGIKAMGLSEAIRRFKVYSAYQKSLSA